MAVLDTHWHANPKILALGLDAMGLHAWSISYCDAELTDGFIPEGALPSLPRMRTAIKTLINAGRYIREPGGFRLHDYLKHNRSREEVEEIVKSRREAGRAGGLANSNKAKNGLAPAQALAQALAMAPAQALATAPAQALAQANGKQTLKQNPTPGPGATSLAVKNAVVVVVDDPVALETSGTKRARVSAKRTLPEQEHDKGFHAGAHFDWCPACQQQQRQQPSKFSLTGDDPDGPEHC